MQISKALECVQAARRVHQFNHMKSVNVPGLEGHGDEEEIVGKLKKSK